MITHTGPYRRVEVWAGAVKVYSVVVRADGADVKGGIADGLMTAARFLERERRPDHFGESKLRVTVFPEDVK